MAATGLLRVPTSRGMRGLGDCQWLNGSWVNVLPNGSVEGCGVPPTPPPVTGTGVVSAIENQYQQVIADNPYLSSPAFLAAEAAAGAPDPGAKQDAIDTLNKYCSQNVFNHSVWGTPLDTQVCNGIVPLPSALAPLQTIVTPNFGFNIAPGGGSGTQGGGQTVMTAKPAAPPPPPPPAPTTPVVNAGNNASTDLISGQPAATNKLNPAVAGTPSWFTDPAQELISGVQNWVLLAAGVGAVVLFMNMKGGH